MGAARDRYETLSSSRKGVALTSHNFTLGPDGMEQRVFGRVGLFDRCSALLMDPDVTTLVVVVQTDELLFTGPPFRENVKSFVVDMDIKQSSNPSQTIPEQILQPLKNALHGK